MNTKAEVFFGLPRGDYDKRGEVNWSTLKLIQKSPAHYHAALLATVSPDTFPRARGRAAHVAVLEPDRFRTEYAVFTGKQRRGKKWDAFKAANGDKEIIKSDTHALCLALAQGVRANPAAVPYLSGGRSEVTVVWPFVRERLGAVEGYTTLCRCRIDFVANVGALVDFKSTRDASPSGFGREVARYGHHIQAASYRQAFYAATGKLLPYIFVATEAEWPHVTAVYRVTPKAFDLGWSTYVELHDRLNACRRDNHWPGYGEGEMDLELPHWLEPDDDENDDLAGLIASEAA